MELKSHETSLAASELTNVLTLIANSYSAETAEEFCAFEPSDDDFNALKTACREVLLAFKPVPGACVLMSALVRFRLESLSKAPAYVVAGSLAVRETAIFGTSDAKVESNAFSKTNLSWDGHCWVQFGDYIVDVSIIRTAYSSKSPPVLAKHIKAVYGENRGVLIAKQKAMIEDGLIYTPQHVLTKTELDPLINGGLQILSTMKV